jgi:prepilin-type N-terminal cleavage/methylation domain-containing protein
MSRFLGLRRFRRAFTLIELLVVIAVIAILIALNLRPVQHDLRKMLHPGTMAGDNDNVWSSMILPKGDRQNIFDSRAFEWGSEGTDLTGQRFERSDGDTIIITNALNSTVPKTHGFLIDVSACPSACQDLNVDIQPTFASLLVDTTMSVVPITRGGFARASYAGCKSGEIDAPCAIADDGGDVGDSIFEKLSKRPPKRVMEIYNGTSNTFATSGSWFYHVDSGWIAAPTCSCFPTRIRLGRDTDRVTYSVKEESAPINAGIVPGSNIPLDWLYSEHSGSVFMLWADSCVTDFNCARAAGFRPKPWIGIHPLGWAGQPLRWFSRSPPLGFFFLRGPTRQKRW